jgi:hypothetical protein
MAQLSSNHDTGLLSAVNPVVMLPPMMIPIVMPTLLAMIITSIMLMPMIALANGHRGMAICVHFLRVFRQAVALLASTLRSS